MKNNDNINYYSNSVSFVYNDPENVSIYRPYKLTTGGTANTPSIKPFISISGPITTFNYDNYFEYEQIYFCVGEIVPDSYLTIDEYFFGVISYYYCDATSASDEMDWCCFLYRNNTPYTVYLQGGKARLEHLVNYTGNLVWYVEGYLTTSSIKPKIQYNDSSYRYWYNRLNQHRATTAILNELNAAKAAL